jgi:hypothetical protein
MAIPVGVPRVTVTTGLPIITPGGGLAKGKLTFTGPDLVTVGPLDLLLGGGEPAYLAAGVATIDLVPNDLAGMSPVGWTYRVDAEFADPDMPDWSRHIAVTSGVSPLQLADILIADPALGSFVVVPGPTGATGSAGADGASAYAVAVANGFVGSQSAWLASLVGAAGPKGDPGAGGAPPVIVDVAIEKEIVVLQSTATWTIVACTDGTEIAAKVRASVGQRVRCGLSWMRTGGVVYYDVVIKAAAGGISRFLASGTSTPKLEGNPAYYPQSNFPGSVAPRLFTVQAGEVDGAGLVTIALAYKGPADGATQKVYAHSDYPLFWTLENVDA